jgi:hypothetical protein
MLTANEIHQLAMTVVGEALKEDGFEFLAVNSKPKKDPQFVCLKEKKLHFVVVKGCCYPQNPKEYDVKLLQKVKKHGSKYNARTYFAGVGFAHAKDYDLPLKKEDPYVVNYQGLQEIL